MYIIKIKGRAKIPDYIQVRDLNYTLVAYFRADFFPKWIKETSFAERENEIKEIISDLPYGKFFKLFSI